MFSMSGLMAVVTQRHEVAFVIASTIDALSDVVHRHSWMDSARPTPWLGSEYSSPQG